MTTWLDDLRSLHPCADALNWASDYSSLEAAWAACRRGDWMLWYIGHRVGHLPPDSPQRRALVLAAGGCARLALRYVPPGELRPLRAIEAAESWGRGEAITLTDVRVAADADTAAARRRTLEQCADIVRQHYPSAPAIQGKP